MILFRIIGILIMTTITTAQIPHKGGEGYVLLAQDDAIPASTVWRFKKHGDGTTILFNDQASGGSKYGSVNSLRDKEYFDYPLQDVIMAFQIASRGYIVDLQEFCEKLKAKRNSTGSTQEKFTITDTPRNSGPEVMPMRYGRSRSGDF